MAFFSNRIWGGRTGVSGSGKAVSGSEQKAQTFFDITDLADPSWTGRNFRSLSNEGYAKNPVVYRCVRMIAEAANRVPLRVVEDGVALSDHPVTRLLDKPNMHQSGKRLMESVYAYLQTAGNAYLDAAFVDGEVRAFFELRPDRMHVMLGKDGWPCAYAYTAGGKTIRFNQDTKPIPRVLHLTLFNPLDDHYGQAPLEAAQMSLDIHNAASKWNKSLLDNAARPSGALVYSAAAGNLSQDQFDRLKNELEEGFQGAQNAGRPMVLEGGLDWKSIALTPKDMDFIEAKNGAAREIALAFGVPPMLLGISGDNTYANFAEANRTFWRQTITPLVNRVAASMTHWLQPAFATPFKIEANFENIEALAEDRSVLWKRVSDADFLSDAEKRAMLGVNAVG